MRTKLVTLAAAGALVLGGGAVAGTAMAATDDSTPTPKPSSSGATPGSGSDAGASRVERIKQALAGLVADKTLTQAQADKVAETLAASGVARGPGHGHGGPGGFGRRHGKGLAAAAEALGLSESDLLAQLRAGKSLAAVAKDKGVAVDKVVDALVADAQQRLADAVKAGRITQAEADQRLKDLRARITERVNATRPAKPGVTPQTSEPESPMPGSPTPANA